MLRRLLNIASIACLVLCVALMGMWVRSCRLTDRFRVLLPCGCDFAGDLTTGRVTFYLMLSLDSPHHSYWETKRVEDADDVIPSGYGFWFSIGFRFDQWPLGYALTLPYYFLALVSGSLAMIFRLRWPPQFTLRSLFIATTFLAIVLGMIAWLDRAWIGR